MAKFTRKYYVY